MMPVRYILGEACKIEKDMGNMEEITIWEKGFGKMKESRDRTERKEKTMEVSNWEKRV